MFKKLWDKINGSKTVIGTVILVASMGVQAFFPHALSPEQFQFIDLVGATISGVGLAHKGVKTYKSTKVTTNKE